MILPNGETLLHKLADRAQHLELLELRFSEFKDHFIFCLDNNGKSPITKALESLNFIGANIILKMLITDQKFSSHSHIISHDLPEIIKANIRVLPSYLDSRL